MPATVDRTTMIAQKAKVFFTPMIPARTSMLGSDRAGPARSRERAGPLPIPAPMRPCRMGTSVKVAKYMSAPETEANRLAHKEFPPTRLWI